MEVGGTQNTQVGVPALSVHPMLAVIVFIDMVAYSRLIALDVTGTLLRFRRLRDQLITPLVQQHTGRLVQTGGDSLLLTFDSATAAVTFAVDLQRALPSREADATPDKQIRFRVGIDMGDVIQDGSDLHGNNVNIAEQLQAVCPTGGVCISRTVHDQVRSQTPEHFEFLGSPTLKNIAQPVEAFVWCGDTPSLSWPAEGELMRRTSTPFGSGACIAVLPFRTVPMQHDDYFAEGVVEDIIHVLSAQKHIFIVTRTSSVNFMKRGVDSKEAAVELGVRYLLGGSIRRESDLLRIRVELTDVETGIVLSSMQYDGSPEDIFKFQQEIAIRVAGTIAPQVREHELRLAMRKPSSSLSAYDLVLKALDNLYRPESEAFMRSRVLLEQAKVLDPYYAPAYSYLAYWHILDVGEGRSPDPVTDARAAASAAGSAFELDANDALALAIYGHVQSFLLRDYGRGLHYLDRAVDIGPNSAMAWSMSSATRGYLNEGAKAVDHAQRGLLLAPLDAHVFWHEALFAQALYLNNQYDEAIAVAERVLWRKPDLMTNLRVLIASQAAAGRTSDACVSAQRLVQVRPQFRLTDYAPHCPFRGIALQSWLQRLGEAGLPE
jgi:TolB-like protein/class 3 adenylate cyclase